MSDRKQPGFIPARPGRTPLFSALRRMMEMARQANCPGALPVDELAEVHRQQALSRPVARIVRISQEHESHQPRGRAFMIRSWGIRGTGCRTAISGICQERVNARPERRK